MKKIVLLAVLVLLLLVSTPVAAGDKEPVGDYLGWGVTEFPANEPFFKFHGFWFTEDELANDVTNLGGYYFELELDGEIIKPSYKIIGYDPEINEYNKWYVYNFPEGMTGTHTFTGHYYGACQDYFDDCKNPGAGIEIWTPSNTVEFTEP